MTDLDPRQQDFLKYYIDRSSETFSNAYQSAIKAGYAEEYARNLTSLMPDWLSEFIDKLQRMLIKAEKALEDSLEDIEDKKLRQDTAKFIASRLGKKHYSERQELTGMDGKDLTINIINYDNTNSAQIPAEKLPDPSIASI